jgi:hypothetical protein
MNPNRVAKLCGYTQKFGIGSSTTASTLINAVTSTFWLNKLSSDFSIIFQRDVVT